MENKNGYPRRLPIGYRRVEENGKVRIEIDPAKADGLRLALALHESGRLSVRQIAKVVAPHGITDGKGEPLAPAAMWRLIRRRATRSAGA